MQKFHFLWKSYTNKRKLQPTIAIARKSLNLREFVKMQDCKNHGGTLLGSYLTSFTAALSNAVKIGALFEKRL